MKTKKMFAMFAAAAMMLTTSCSNDETFDQFDQLGNEAQVTFSLGLENAMNTRAISDGSGINQLAYAIFDRNGKIVSSAKGEEATTFPFNVDVTLIKGETYTAVFWAQSQLCNAYTVSDDFKTVKVNYYDLIDGKKHDHLNNDETRDAFFRSETFTVEENATLEIVLKRPFAQLNVGVSEEEWNSAVKLGYTIANSAVVIKNAATTLNLMDGSVSDEEEVTFTANTIPSEKLLVDINCDGTSEKYTYLSMSYFLADSGNDGAAKTTLEDLKFTFTSADGNTSSVLERGLQSVPVQRNHRTNIIGFGDGLGDGGIITGEYTVKVVLDPLYDGEHTETSENVWEDYKGIYTEEALAGMDIEIPAGWHIRNGYILEEMPEYWENGYNAEKYGREDPLVYEKPYSINGNRNTVTFEPYDYHFSAKNVFAAANNALVSVKDLNFAGEHSGIYAGVYSPKYNKYTTKFESVNVKNNGLYAYNNNEQTPLAAFTNYGTTELINCIMTGAYWVGEDKDNHPELAEVAMNKFGGVYDVFAPNSTTTKIDNCTIGKIYVNSQGHLEVTGTSKVEKIVGDTNQGMVFGSITIDAGAEVGNLEVLQYSNSNSYTYKLTIKAKAKIKTLYLNWKENHTLNKANIVIEEGAEIDEIFANGKKVESLDDIQ